MNQITISSYKQEYAKDFARINYEWLEQYFVVEVHDRELLDDPENHIIKAGGEILFALLDDIVIGTVALIPKGNGQVELTKMGVSKEFRGYKAGKLLMEAAVEKCKEMGFKEIILESNRSLTPALTLYRSFGFEEIELDPNTEYVRADIRMSLSLS